nr:hypothetical protein [Tanacetum cinerariifolium]
MNVKDMKVDPSKLALLRLNLSSLLTIPFFTMENSNSLSPPRSLTSPIRQMVRKLNELLESLNLVVLPPLSETSCLEKELGLERLFEEIEIDEIKEELEEETNEEFEEDEEEADIGVI